MRSQDVSPLLSSSAPLLCPLPHPRQDELAVQRRTPPGAPSSSTTTPHPASLRLLAASYLNSIRRGRQLFSNPSPPPPPVVGGTQHDLACFQFLSSLFFSFSFFFLLNTQVGAVCTSEDNNYWQKHLHWNNCDILMLFLMPIVFFCIDIFTDCHLDLTVYVCLFYCLKYDSHLVE